MKFLVLGSDTEVIRHQMAQMMTLAALLKGIYSQGHNFSSWG